MPSVADIERGPLCVGGPKDGQRVKTELGEPRFMATITKRLPRSPIAADAPIMSSLPDRVEYHLLLFRTVDRDYPVWAPAGQDEGQTMALLLASYEDARKR